MRAQVSRLPNGRLHLNDGPIDLIISCDGRREEIAKAEQAAVARFANVLDELCSELPLLRRPTGKKLNGTIARRMWQATSPFAARHFITPMAAVAGSVAEEILEALTSAASLTRCLVNNGGDIAIHLAPGQRYRVGLIDRPETSSLFATTDIGNTDPVRGIATSGWRGRSFSLGIADAVTVLAPTAAMADAAATLIANAVDLPGHRAVSRKPARDLQPDSDLGARAVTTAVGALSSVDIDEALASGLARAEEFRARNLIIACALHLQGETRTLGSLTPSKVLTHA